jgi:integrase
MATNQLIVTQGSGQTAVLLAAIARANLADGSKAVYRSAVLRMADAGINWRDARQLRAYGRDLSDHQKLALRSALKHAREEELWELYADATPDNGHVITAVEQRWKAINDAIATSSSKGSKPHQWLSDSELVALLKSCEKDARGARDEMAIWLMGDCGLRRSEAAAARFADIGFQGGAPVLHVVGKGKKGRDVPLHGRAHKLAMSIQAAHGGVFLLKSVDRHGNVSDGISGRALTNIVRERGAAVGRVKLAPHDLRRTGAQIRRRAGLDLEQIRQWLGHESLETTRRYLGVLDAATLEREFIMLDEKE